MKNRKKYLTVKAFSVCNASFAISTILWGYGPSNGFTKILDDQQ